MTITQQAPVKQAPVAALLPEPPSNHEKLSYLERNRAYLIATIITGGLSLIGSQLALEDRYGFWWLMPFTIFMSVYIATGLFVHSAGQNFDYEAHKAFVSRWLPPYPDVDIYLPICGESLEVLRNTWTYVFELTQSYPGLVKVYVMDDGADPEARVLAATHGFSYLVRPDRGYMGKAGNMRHAFGRTSGELIVIFDADFTPRPDFLTETLPYFRDPALGILQTPQFFQTDQRQTWVERAGNAVQEVFYRNIQQARDNFGAVICCGTCAVYRRSALDQDGGFTEVPDSEDEHTGLAVRERGYTVKYIPVALAAGVSPTTIDTFVRQQHRWCSGTLSTVRHWPKKMPWRGKLMYISGLFYYLYSAVLIFVSPVVPLLLLLLIPTQIQPRDYLALVPALFSGMLMYPLWHRCKFGPATFPLDIIRSWAHALALADFLTGRKLQWQASGAAVSHVRRLRACLWGWNGGTAAVWLSVLAWRVWQYGPSRFWVLALFALFYAGIVTQILWSYERT